MRRSPFVAAAFSTLLALAVAAAPQPGFVELTHPAIQYSAKPPRDPVAELTRKIEAGRAGLDAEGPAGYLRSILQALDVPVTSQIMVFSNGSVQGRSISARNPRALFFNESVVVGWVRGGFIEIAAQDPEQGTRFYVVNRNWLGRPSIEPRDSCLSCHFPHRTLGVPGMIEPGSHRRPFEERWGGWYVTGNLGSIRHLGNVAIETLITSPSTVNTASLRSLEGEFDTTGYLTPFSDVAALLVFEHQMQMMNLLTRAGWDTRVARHEGRLDAARTVIRARIDELVDYMLFADEARLASKVEGTSGFSEAFSAPGPRDTKGRSLRDLDLTTRLLRYPCSYMIYSPQFERLPSEAKAAIYERMWTILSGAEKGSKYARLTAADRRAIVEILRDTKHDLPGYFK